MSEGSKTQLVFAQDIDADGSVVDVGVGRVRPVLLIRALTAVLVATVVSLMLVVVLQRRPLVLPPSLTVELCPQTKK